MNCLFKTTRAGKARFKQHKVTLILMFPLENYDLYQSLVKPAYSFNNKIMVNQMVSIHLVIVFPHVSYSLVLVQK